MQFTQITLEEALELKRIGIINAVGLTYLYFQIKLRSGWEGTFDPAEICKELDISKSSFYRCLSICKVQGYLDFETTGKLKVKNLKPAQGGGCLKTDTTCVKNETTASKVGQPVSKVGQTRQKLENLVKTETASLKNETEATPKPLPEAEPGDSPYSYQINQISSSSIKEENANPDEEEEEVKNFSLPEKPVKANKHKPAIKALKSILEECSEDPQEWEKFFDWADEHLWPSFETPIDNKIGWLKSTDPETELSRLESNWFNYTSQPNENAPKTLDVKSAWEKALKIAGSQSMFTWDSLMKLVPQDKEPKLHHAIKEAGGLSKIARADEQFELPAIKKAFIEAYKNFSPA